MSTFDDLLSAVQHEEDSAVMLSILREAQALYDRDEEEFRHDCLKAVVLSRPDDIRNRIMDRANNGIGSYAAIRRN